MTGLEAIEIIRDRLIEYKNKAEGKNIKCLVSPQFAQVITELKALEIIKGKNVNIYQIKYMETLDDYNSARGEEDRLTEEEFNLLKEVLE